MERKSSLPITRNTENKKLDNTLIKENCLIQQNLSGSLRHRIKNWTRFVESKCFDEFKHPIKQV